MGESCSTHGRKEKIQNSSRQFGDLGFDGMMILKRILKKKDVRMSNGFTRLRLGQIE